MSASKGALAGLRVMLVEDDVRIAKLLQMMLKVIDVQVVFTANDGLQALRFLSANEGSVNTLICDWRMPNMTGIELLRQVRSVDPDLQFLMITGYATPESVLEARGLNVSAFITKPFSAKTISDKLELAASKIAG